MSTRYSRHALACMLALGFNAAVAANQPAPTSSNFDRVLQANEQALRAHRADFVGYFAEAYQRYPNLPAGSLEAIAYSASRWQHVVPDSKAEAHQHQPPAYGVMGLRHGEGGFGDLLTQASQASGISVTEIIQLPRSNILATAALLSQWLSDRHAKAVRLEDLVPELTRLSGIGGSKRSAVSEFAAEAYAYDVLLAADRGFDDQGIRVPEKAIEWERALPIAALQRQRAPFVRLDMDKDAIDGSVFDQISGTLKDSDAATKSTDYGPALWVASPYYSTRSAAVSAVTIHTMQGSYAGSISWFQSNPYSVSAQYLIRSSDGQITQMVRESKAAHHVGSHNSYTQGIEHEGYVNNAAWYTTAMYNASAALTRHFCTRYGIPCSSAYNGASSSGLNVLPTSTKIKGHQHYSSQSHTDPGINWDWRRYYTLLNPGSGGSVTTVLDSFETSEGHFNQSPAYSGSTTGISTASTADRVSSMKKNGGWSEQLMLVDNASSTASWAVRFLSGGGTPSANASLAKAGGRVGFWVYSGGTGLTAALGIDDSDGTERSVAKTIPANAWTYLEWKLDDSSQWSAWVGGNGAITASSVTLDAIWFYRAQTSYTVYVYIDDVSYRKE
ncbi:MAG: N-acetylmuramoyl-L-alanine amidase [Lysobacterales bacterium]